MLFTQSHDRIILRRKATFTRSTSAGPMLESNTADLAEIQLEQASMTEQEVADVRRDPEVTVVADAMPLKLIEPVQDSNIQIQQSGNTWGIEAIGAHTSSFDGAGVVVAVLDTGINPGHDAFQGVILERENFTTDSPDDTNGHGTHCAGTIFGRDINGLQIGVAKGVTRALIGKVLGQGGGTSATLANAINWAYRGGANVISMSLGIDFPGYVDWLVNTQGFQVAPATSIALEAYRANVNLFSSLSLFLDQSGAFSQAAVIVAASGNESNRPSYIIAVAPPAAGDGLISVGALQQMSANNLAVASFSNTQCNLSAPGVNVTSAWIGGKDSLKAISGTSMATPHVAGCAALWAQQQMSSIGHLTNQNLAARVLASSKFISGAHFEDIGNGIVQAPQ